MQLKKKDHICFAFQKKQKKKKRVWLSLYYLTIFTAEQNPAITAIIIIENHNVRGQHLITSQWSQPTFEK